MEGANRIYMKKNTFENNGWALKIQASCMDVVLERNNFIGNTFDVGTNGSLVKILLTIIIGINMKVRS